MPRNYSEEERLTEDEIARRKLGPRGVPLGEDSAKMTPQQEKKLLGQIAAHMAKANDADSSDRRVVRRTALARRPINLPCPSLRATAPPVRPIGSGGCSTAFHSATSKGRVR